MLLGNDNHWLVVLSHVGAQQETFDELFANRGGQVSKGNKEHADNQEDLNQTTEVVHEVQRRHLASGSIFSSCVENLDNSSVVRLDG